MTTPDGSIQLARQPGFILGGIEVRPATRELAAGGRSEVLEPRVMQVLVTLAGRRGQVVSRDDLITACWGGRAVGEDAINRCIQAIRRVARTHGGFEVTTVARVGYRLDEQAPAAPVAPPASDSPGAERRRLTVLSCRLARSADESAASDPETWHVLVTEYRRAAAAAIDGLGGYLAPGQGDSLTVYFGYPQAREDAALCAVRAGLALVAAMPALNARLGRKPQTGLAVRVGVHAGQVLVTHTADGEPEMFGEAAEVAARIQARAAPNTVLVSAAVRDLAAEGFTLAPRGEDAADAGPLFQAIAAGSGRQAGGRARTPFVGREDELQLLRGRWARVRDGEGQMMLVMGEPGIGKTRLVEEFRAAVLADAAMVIGCASAPLFANSPFHTIAQLLEQGLGWGGSDGPESRIRRLEQAPGSSAMNLAEAVPLIAEMLNLPLPDTYSPLSIPAEQNRRRLMAVLVEWVLNAARDRPLLVVVEDLHWVDPSSLELLQTLVEQGATTPLMLLFTTRPEGQPAWPVRAHHSQVRLDRLNRKDTRRLVDGLVQQTDLPERVVDAVIQRSDGVPLFAEELTRLVLDTADKGVPAAAGEIPTTLVDSLAARIDRLGSAKAVLQLAAVLGREFTHELLQAVSPLSEAGLQAALTRLADAELIQARGLPPAARYRFKHALIQDAAYDGLLKSRRRELHRRAANILVERFPDLAEAQPEQLARHWAEGGEAALAISHLKTASAEAARRRAYQEAIGHLRHAIEALSSTPQTEARDREEVVLLGDLHPLIGLARGFGSAELEPVLNRSRELCERTGQAPELWRTVFGLHDYHVNKNNHVAARAFAAQLLTMAQETGEPTRMASAHYSAGIDAFVLGDFAAALAHFDVAIANRPIIGDIVPDQLRFWARWYSLRCLTILGRFQQAQDRAEINLAEATAQAHPLLLAVAHWGSALVAAIVGRYDDADRHVDALQARAEELSARPYAVWAQVHRAGILLRRGRYQDAVDMGEPAVAEAGRLGIVTNQATQFHWALGKLGRAAEGLEKIEAMAAHFRRTGDVSYLAGLHRIRADLLLMNDPQCTEEAERELRRAIEIARGQGARWYELKAVMSLARLMESEQRRAEARALLAETYAGFTEGFDAADLKTAKALLDALGG